MNQDFYYYLALLNFLLIYHLMELVKGQYDASGQLKTYLAVTQILHSKLHSSCQSCMYACMHLTTCFLFKSKKHGSFQICMAKIWIKLTKKGKFRVNLVTSYLETF